MVRESGASLGLEIGEELKGQSQEVSHMGQVNVMD